MSKTVTKNRGSMENIYSLDGKVPLLKHDEETNYARQMFEGINAPLVILAEALIERVREMSEEDYQLLYTVATTMMIEEKPNYDEGTL